MGAQAAAGMIYSLVYFDRIISVCLDSLYLIFEAERNLFALKIRRMGEFYAFALMNIPQRG